MMRIFAEIDNNNLVLSLDNLVLYHILSGALGPQPWHQTALNWLPPWHLTPTPLARVCHQADELLTSLQLAINICHQTDAVRCLVR